MLGELIEILFYFNFDINNINIHRFNHYITNYSLNMIRVLLMLGLDPAGYPQVSCERE